MKDAIFREIAQIKDFPSETRLIKPARLEHLQLSDSLVRDLLCYLECDFYFDYRDRHISLWVIQLPKPWCPFSQVYDGWLLDDT